MNEEQVGQETSASIGLRLRGARSLDQMGLNVVHHLVGIHPNSRCAHQTSQLLVGDDEAAILRILQLVVLDVGPHPLDELESRALLNSSEVCQDLVGQEDLLQILVSSVARHGGTSLASERRKNMPQKKIEDLKNLLPLGRRVSGGMTLSRTCGSGSNLFYFLKNKN